MVSWYVSEKLKKEIIEKTKNLDSNSMRFLYLLNNLGPLRFTSLLKYSGLSRSTVSKYLKKHINQNSIEKKIYKDEAKNIQEQRYFITELGIDKLGDLSFEQLNKIYFNKLNDILSGYSELIKFYRNLNVEESIIFRILRVLTKIGETFLQIEHNRDFYLTLFYIFHNSVLTRDYKFELEAFCKYYKVKRLRIDYYVDKIMSGSFGFFMFLRDEDVFFFHEQDLLGTTIVRLIRDTLMDDIIHIHQSGYRKVYDLDGLAENMADKLLRMDLIWEKIKEPLEMLIEKIIIKTALDMGFSKLFLMDIVIQSEKITKSSEGTNSLINIINGSTKYEDLNLVSISAIEGKETREVFLEKLKGFCPNCGRTILKTDLSNICINCGNQFDKKDLIKSIDSANRVSKLYKKQKLQKEKLIKCPNTNCDAKIQLDWDECPACHIKLKE
ncbi:MAG: hypothetical protein GF383_06925 [Candidatus Lokiarchaeota archaeon]|nr:hypothetical protein [Candidatus Lokiarchaeota archaeon]MBD3339882.1 hypothetical protein [Candidatus Lokiarchaeota archaeon]